MFVILLPFFLSGVLYAQGEPVTAEMAQTVAANHVRMMESEWKAVPELKGQEVTVGEVHNLSNPETRELLGYVVDFAPRGFVVVPGNTAIHPVIAYSFHGNFFFDEDPENHLLWMLTYDLDLRHELLSETPPQQFESPKVLWETYLLSVAHGSDTGRTGLSIDSISIYPKPGLTVTGGWIQVTWTQGSPFKDMCPMDLTTGNRCIVGCTATAFTMLVHNWARDYLKRMDFAGFDSTDCYLSRGRHDSLDIYIDQDAEAFDFPSFSTLNGYMDEMTFYYENELPLGQHAAALSFACGILVKMCYSSSGSGASIGHIPAALENKFYYKEGGNSVSHSDSSFYNRLSQNMTDNMPAVLHIAQSQGSGEHAILCDGFARAFIGGKTTCDFYHLNFGWGWKSPDSITVAWYHLPDGMPANYDIIRYGILDIHP